MDSSAIVPAGTPLLHRSIGLARDIGEGIDRYVSPPPRCAIGAPPRALRAFHDVYFVNAFWRRLERAILHPAEVDTSLGFRRVSVLGLAVYEFLPDGTVETSLWRCDHDAPPERRAIGTDSMVMTGTPYGTTWLDVFREGFAYEHRNRFQTSSRETSAYVEWAWPVFENRIRRTFDLRVMRATIARALALDPWACAVAHRLYRRAGRGALPTMYAAYNLVVRHRETFATLERETPNLIPLFGIFLGENDVFPRDGEPAARLKAHLVEWYGLSQRLWRLVAKGRGRLLAEFLPFYETEPISSTVDLLRVFDLLRMRAMPPRWLLRELLSFFADPGKPAPAFGDCPEFSSVAWRRIVSIAERADDDTLASMQRNLALVLVWLHDEGDGLATRTLRLAPWSWFVGRAQAWQHECEARARVAGRKWAVPNVAFDAGVFRIVPIADGETLLREARVMHDCVDNYVDACADGKALVFSIRREGETRPHAHVLFERRTGGWALVRAAGFANSVPSAKADALVKVICAKLKGATRQEREAISTIKE